MAIGASLVVAPRLIGPMWIGDPSDGPVVKLMSRALGARDLALGLGVAVALDRGAPVRGWLEGAALADGVDLVATLLAGGAVPRGKRRRGGGRAAGPVGGGGRGAPARGPPA